MNETEILDIDESLISFWIVGVAAPGGSKKFLGLNRRTGRAILADDAGARNKNWRAVVGWYATHYYGQRKPLTGPLRVSFDFVMPRLKSHFNKKGELKEKAPIFHTVKPDTTKLIRSTEDALKGILWVDDSQICRQSGSKLYGDRPGCQITIKPL